MYDTYGTRQKKTELDDSLLLGNGEEGQSVEASFDFNAECFTPQEHLATADSLQLIKTETPSKRLQCTAFIARFFRNLRFYVSKRHEIEVPILLNVRSGGVT